MIRRKLVAGLAVALLGVTAAGCTHNAKVTSRDTAPAEKVNMPDRYDTIATKCNHGNRIYEASSTGVTVVPGDPSCRKAQGR